MYECTSLHWLFWGVYLASTGVKKQHPWMAEKRRQGAQSEQVFLYWSCSSFFRDNSQIIHKAALIETRAPAGWIYGYLMVLFLDETDPLQHKWGHSNPPCFPSRRTEATLSLQHGSLRACFWVVCFSETSPFSPNQTTIASSAQHDVSNGVDFWPGGPTSDLVIAE